MSAWWFSTFETVVIETPRSLAMRFIVVVCMPGPPVLPTAANFSADALTLPVKHRIKSAMTLQQLAKDTCIVRNTAARKGRHIAVEPGDTAMRYLRYGRIVLDGGDAPIRFDTGELETGLICLKGSATVTTGGQSFTLGRLDSVYAPRGSSIEVTAGSGGCDLAEVAAPVDDTYPVQFVPLADVQKDAGLHFTAGKETN